MADSIPFSQRGERVLYRQARDGFMPAEALPRYLRHRLVRELHALGWTDSEVAEWTAMTTYTAARIRWDILTLPPNRLCATELAA